MAFATALRSFSFDQRLFWLIGAAALALGVEFGLRAWDAHQKLDAELQGIRGRAAVLAASSDQIDWLARTRAADAERAALRARLWQSPTQAQAQARLRDWLNSTLASAAVQRPLVNLLPLQAPAVAASGAAAALPALRVRATAAFELTPGALENALVQIEAGAQLARIDNLNVTVRGRRVEMTVSVPVLIESEKPK